ncbi:MAG: selenocysteine-specific translation elongation factor [Chloroflexota bacterium]
MRYEGVTVKVIGTAGHIDHGKSTLVRHLTGIDPDRLEEEKRRGMTIDLGFAWFSMPSGETVSVVDVPGHERFVKTMLAGAAGIDMALVVIAVDEGVMPQTREHLDILELLEVRRGVVALTKTDLVDEEWVGLITDQVREALSHRILGRMAIVPVSSVTGAGIDTLLARMSFELAKIGDRPQATVHYLPVDRVFAMKGFGTVLTGTLQGGEIRQGDPIEIVPGGRRGRIRGLQTHNNLAERAAVGDRVALNVVGLSRDDVRRGDVAAEPGTIVETDHVDAFVRVLPEARAPLVHGAQVMAHLGAAERSAAIRVLSGSVIEPGSSGWVRLRFGDSVGVIRRQHVVLRVPAPGRTIAGGLVADPSPARRRIDAAGLERLESLLSDNLHIAAEAALSGRRPRTAPEIARLLGVDVETSSRTLNHVVANGCARRLSNSYVTGAGWQQMTERIRAKLAKYHETFPSRRGMPREELRRKVGWTVDTWSAALTALERDETVRTRDSVVSLPDHRGGIDDRREQADRVIALLRQTPYAPPAASAAIGQVGADSSLLLAMVEEGSLVRVDEDLYFDRETLEAMTVRVLDSIRSEGQVTVAQVRDAFGTSRKYALATLEYLDGEHLTRRIGEARILGSKA